MLAQTESFILDLSVVIKASEADGKRLVAVEASNEEVDKEGDVILQKALLDSQDTFLKGGHFDIDHISELGLRMGITNPDRYVIGYPTKVTDLGKGRTGVEGEIFRNKDGSCDPNKFIYDSFWTSLQTNPPTRWRASIYGKAREVDTSGKDAPRHVVKAIEWKSLAFTKRPVNDQIKGEAHIITAKAYVDIIKSEMQAAMGAASTPVPAVPGITSRQAMLDEYYGHVCRSCPHTDEGNFVNAYSIREHFEKCKFMGCEQADIQMLAMLKLVELDKK